MKRAICNLIIFLAIFASLISCQKDENIILEEEPTQKEFPNVDEALWQFFENFELAGQARGIDVDLIESTITGVIENISQEHVAGQCTYGTFNPGEIVIDSEFWNSASFFLKEMVVFHELGHCFLHRNHAEGDLGNGACASIMRSGVEGCFDNYNPQTRDYYLDELFSLGN